MSTSELALCLADRQTITVAFAGEDSGPLSFTNPPITKNYQDLRWYVEICGAVSIGDPDDGEAQRNVIMQMRSKL